MRHSISIRDDDDDDEEEEDKKEEEEDDDDDDDDDDVLVTTSVPAIACRRGISANMFTNTSSSTFITNLRTTNNESTQLQPQPAHN